MQGISKTQIVFRLSEDEAFAIYKFDIHGSIPTGRDSP
jgi:hypothetical protein